MTMTGQAAITASGVLTHPYLPVFLAPFLAWQVYKRTRSQIGRQPLITRRLVWRIFIFAAMTAGYVALSLSSRRSQMGLVGGIIAGGLGAWLGGLRLTRFETTPEGKFYWPNLYIGISLTLLLIGRLVYRFIVLNSAPPDFLENYPARFQSPLTAFLFGLTAGYYIAYSAGVMWRGRRMELPAR